MLPRRGDRSAQGLGRIGYHPLVCRQVAWPKDRHCNRVLVRIQSKVSRRAHSRFLCVWLSPRGWRTIHEIREWTGHLITITEPCQPGACVVLSGFDSWTLAYQRFLPKAWVLNFSGSSLEKGQTARSELLCWGRADSQSCRLVDPIEGRHCWEIIVNFTPMDRFRPKMMPMSPVSVNEIVEDVHRAVDMGITMVYLHARETKRRVPPMCRAVRKRMIAEHPEIRPRARNRKSPRAGRGSVDLSQRLEPLQLDGDLKPDMGSLTLSSLNFNTRVECEHARGHPGTGRRDVQERDPP